MKNIFAKLNLKKTLLELLSIAITLAVIFFLIKIQKNVSENNNDIDFSKLGVVRIINIGSGKYLSASNVSDGSQVSQFSKDEGKNQVWQIEKEGNGWSIKLANTNSCLEIDNGSREDGARSQIWNCLGAPQQIWQIEKIDKGIYQLHPSYDGKCLEVNDSSSDEGALTQQWSCAEVMGQRWQIYSALY